VGVYGTTVYQIHMLENELVVGELSLVLIGNCLNVGRNNNGLNVAKFLAK